MPDVALWGAVYPEVTEVQLPVNGGGTALFSYGGGGGTGFEHVGQLYDHTWKFSETDYNGWTPSTTVKTIISGAKAGTFVATSLVDHDYWSQWRIEASIVYNSGTATAKAMLDRVLMQNWYAISRRASNIANLDSGTRNSGVAENVTNLWISHYATSATAWTVAWSQSYGIYPVNAAPTFNSSTAASPTITVKFPSINVKCSTTYFGTSFASAVDQDKSTIRMVCDVWRSTNVGYRRSMIYDEMIDQWQNGLPD